MTDLASLRRVAFDAGYRMLGSRSDAEDVAQEAMLRLQGTLDAGEVRNPEAYATTVATRIAIDHLRSARVRRETYTGPWLPEPIIEPEASPTEVADSVSYAVLVVLETLGPEERAAFLLREVFGFGYAEIASSLEKSEPAVRQLVSRARKRVAGGRPRLAVSPDDHRRLLDRFVAAAGAGDVEGLRSLLADDVRLVSDGGPRRKAARHPILGADRVSRFVAHLFPKLTTHLAVVPVAINGQPGFVLEAGDYRHLAGTIDVADDRIVAVHWIVNPDKLA